MRKCQSEFEIEEEITQQEIDEALGKFSLRDFEQDKEFIAHQVDESAAAVLQDLFYFEQAEQKLAESIIVNNMWRERLLAFHATEDEVDDLF